MAEELRPAHDSLPVPAAAGQAEPARLPAPFLVQDLVRDLAQASRVVEYVSARGDDADSDVRATALTALWCVGSTPAAALQAAAACAREDPSLEVHALAWARMPGPAEDTWEYHLTLTVSGRDPLTGEPGGATHHATRRR
jgi:hypothetical protein